MSTLKESFIRNELKQEYATNVVSHRNDHEQHSIFFKNDFNLKQEDANKDVHQIQLLQQMQQMQQLQHDFLDQMQLRMQSLENTVLNAFQERMDSFIIKNTQNFNQL